MNLFGVGDLKWSLDRARCAFDPIIPFDTPKRMRLSCTF